MHDLKRVFKNSAKTSIIVLVYGALTRSNIIYLGMFGGSLLSILSLYMMTMEAKKIIYSRSAKRVAVLGYLKRYAMYGVFLGVMAHYYGVPMLIGSAMGLLNIKINVCLLVLSENIESLKNKYFK